MKKNRKRVDYLTQEDKDNAPILLQDIKKIFAEKKVDKIFTCDLAKYLCELPESRWKSYFGMYHIKVRGRYIGKLLNTYGIHSSILKMDKKRLRGYERSHFEERDDWVTSGLKKGGRTSTNTRLKEYIDTVKKVDQQIAERFLPAIHQLFDENEKLDIDILIYQMLEQHRYAVEIERYCQLAACRERPKYIIILWYMVSALLGGFTFYLGTLCP